MRNSTFAVATPLVIPFVIAQLIQLIACGDAVTSRSSTAAADGPLLGVSSNSGVSGSGSPDIGGASGVSPSPSQEGSVIPTGGLDTSGVTDEGAAGSASTPTAPNAAADAGGGEPPAPEGCGVEPVTPNATQETRNVLCYLHSIYGNKILSGQEENNDDNAANYIQQTTGKYPAIRGFDINNGRAAAQCVDHWRQGGLCMFGYHMGLVGGDGYQGSQTATDVNQVITEGSALNQTFKARLDKTAVALQTVQDAGGVAILRLFHEAGNGCGWFWWGADPDRFVRLWRYTFNYMTATKGLRNIIWLVPLCGSPTPAFNPGKEFTDLGGADSYVGDGNYDALNGLFNRTVAAFPDMPIALHECGPIPDPAALQATATKWLMFNVWTDNYPRPPSNSVDHLNAVYNSEYVLTRDELPAFTP